ncbi:hypothetical protein [Bacillus sp. J33]|nr:hypothetical protein [Bacillus sp. J33]
MWFWIGVIVLPFVILIVIEEIFQLVMKRYMNGPFKLEMKLKSLFTKNSG